MKILFVNRPDSILKPGGDTVQMLKTKEYLEKLGVQIDVIYSGTADFSQYDLVHIFNIQSPKHTLRYLKLSKAENKKTLVSTIYWNLDSIFRQDFLTSGRFNIHRALLGKTLGLKLVNAYLHRIKRSQHKILLQADILLPNSEAEANKLTEDFSLPSSIRQMAIPNAVDQNDFNDLNPGQFKNKHHLDRYIICVARIQIAKNQLNLIKAANKLKIPLVLIGNNSGDSYYKQCQNEAHNGTVHFLPFMDHAEIKNAYAGALCHAMPSLRETPGLSSLEAAICGCPIVSGTEGSQYEYFRNLAYYCDTQSVDSIADAIQQSIKMPTEKRQELKARIIENYTWKITAQKTKEAYDELLSKK